MQTTGYKNILYKYYNNNDDNNNSNNNNRPISRAARLHHWDGRLWIGDKMVLPPHPQFPCAFWYFIENNNNNDDGGGNDDDDTGGGGSIGDDHDTDERKNENKNDDVTTKSIPYIVDKLIILMGFSLIIYFLFLYCFYIALCNRLFCFFFFFLLNSFVALASYSNRAFIRKSAAK